MEKQKVFFTSFTQTLPMLAILSCALDQTRLSSGFPKVFINCTVILSIN